MDQPRITIKTEPDDFRVSEILGRSLSGTGEHTYFYIEKGNLNTLDVLARLSDVYRVDRIQVGYAGRKDKKAITRQWFSVNEPAGQWILPDAELACLGVIKHTRKLRVGELSGNYFEVKCTSSGSFELDIDLLRGWFPNRFGEQRFGTKNLAEAKDWLLNRRSRRVGKRKKGWYLSVLRSFLFNEVLNKRIQHGSSSLGIDGDHLIQGVPTGPLWGRGRTLTKGLAAQLEHDALLPHQDICEGLEYAGVDQGRRPFVSRPSGLLVNGSTYAKVNGSFWLQFGLNAGVYATSLLNHHFHVTSQECVQLDPGNSSDE